jgi:phosphohistidine phosphatase
LPTLILLRHAKSDWDDPVQRDFDRPLNPRGQRAARTVGIWAARNGLTFDWVIASPAVRVRETLAGFAAGLGRDLDPLWEPRAYLASSATLLDLLREHGGSANDTILLAGHNPGLEDLVLDLVDRDADDPLRAAVEVKYPTAAVAELACDGADWAAIRPRGARLRQFVRPRDIDPTLGPDA